MLFPVRIAGGAGALRAKVGAAPLNNAGHHHRRAGWAGGRPREGGLTGFTRLSLLPVPTQFLLFPARGSKTVFRSQVLSSHAGPWELGGKCSGDTRCQQPIQPPPSPHDATPATSRGHSERFRGVLFSDFHSSSLMPGMVWGPSEPGNLPFLLPLPKPHPCLEGQDSPGL